MAVILAWLGNSNQPPGFVVSRMASLSTALKIGVIVRQSSGACRKFTVHDAPEKGSTAEMIN